MLVHIAVEVILVNKSLTHDPEILNNNKKAFSDGCALSAHAKYKIEFKHSILNLIHIQISSVVNGFDE